MVLRDLKKFIESHDLFSGSDTILLAVSGGVDSTVMAYLFREAEYSFAIAHCNFGLRGNDSDQDAEFVKNLARSFNVRFFSEKFDTGEFAAQKGLSIQMAARELRYGWFEKIRHENGFDFVATAHHLDDQAETFLINLIRGTGIAGLHGIPVKKGTVIRPLMFAFRNEIMQYARSNRIIFRTDHSNDETKYLRNKIRHELIPMLTGINPEFVHGLTNTIRRIGEFELLGKHALDEWCRNALVPDGNDRKIDLSLLMQSTPVEAYAWALLSPFGFNETQVSNFLGCLGKENRKIFYSPTHRLVKDRGVLAIDPVEHGINDRPVKIPKFARQKRTSKPVPLFFHRITDVRGFEIPLNENTASLDFDKLRFPLTVRRWQHGDTFFPFGMKKRKKVSDFFIDRKFSLKEKEKTWLLCSGNDIVWIIGHRIDHRFRVTTSTREVLCIVMGDT